MTALRALATLGVVFLVVTVDAVIGGTVAAFWGDVWGCRLGDLLLGTLAGYGVWHLTGRLIP